jgi:outer membrane receptor for ferrienterochelin and colicins
VDVAGDGWLELPRVRRGHVRPRIFFTGTRASLMLTGGVTSETRRGGGVVPLAIVVHDLDMQRADLGGTARLFIGTRSAIDVRGSAMRSTYERRYDLWLERGDSRTTFAELSARSGTGPFDWLVGAAWQEDAFETHDVAGVGHGHEVSSLFGQVDLAVGRLRTSTSARADVHNVYGQFISPRIALLLEPVDGVSLRATGGSGFHAPTALHPDIEEVGLARLATIARLGVERARSASLDAGAQLGDVEVNAAIFGADVRDAVRTRPISGGRLELVNVAGGMRTRGAELLLRYRQDPFMVSASYTAVHATEPSLTEEGRRTVPLTPRSTAGIVAMWEEHDEGRIGIELYHIGRQSLDDDPFRERSKPYFLVGLLLERGMGPIRAFLNLENLTDVRQTRFQPFLRPEPTAAGRWTTDVWAPLDGRVINGGFRIRF